MADRFPLPSILRHNRFMQRPTTPPKFTRRQMALACGGGLLAGALRGASASSHFQGVDINHVALRVSDLTRMEQFLRGHFGSANIHNMGPDWRFLRVERNFTALRKHGQPGLDHFCIAVEDYEADAVEKKCRGLGLTTRRTETWVYILDPDGIEVQLSVVDHDVDAPVVRAAPATSTFKGTGINHVALRVSDIGRSRAFYQEHFGVPVLRETASNCFLGLGKNFLALFKNEKPGLDHYCYSIADYDPAAAMAKLEPLNLNARRHDDRVYFDAPDGITIQLSAADRQP